MLPLSGQPLHAYPPVPLGGAFESMFYHPCPHGPDIINSGRKMAAGRLPGKINGNKGYVRKGKKIARYSPYVTPVRDSTTFLEVNYLKLMRDKVCAVSGRKEGCGR